MFVGDGKYATVRIVAGRFGFAYLLRAGSRHVKFVSLQNTQRFGLLRVVLGSRNYCGRVRVDLRAGSRCGRRVRVASILVRVDLRADLRCGWGLHEVRLSFCCINLIVCAFTVLGFILW